MQRFFSILLTALLATAATALAQIPRIITFQGVLATPAGVPLPDGAHAIQISLYETAIGGTALYTETQSVPVIKGVFNMLIGTTVPIPGAVQFDRPYFISVAVDGGGEMPRTPLTSVPYAFRSSVADSVAPGAAGVVTSVNGASGAVTLAGAGGTTVTQSGNVVTITSTGTGGTGVQGVQNLDGSIAVTNPNGPLVSIGLADGAVTTAKLADRAVTMAKLDPDTAVAGQGILFDGTNVIWGTVSASLALPYIGSVTNANTAVAITNNGSGRAGSFTVNNALNTGPALEVSTNGSGSAILGRIGVGTGGLLTSTPAIRGENAGGTAVAGLSNTGNGMYAYSGSGSGIFATSTNRAVDALAGGTGASYGVFAQATSATGTGVYGLASSTTGTNSGVFGDIYSTANGSGPTSGASGVLGMTTSNSAGAWSAGVRGISNGGTTNSNGVIGYAAGAAKGVYGEAPGGTGVYGRTSTGMGVFAYSSGVGNALWVQHDGIGASTTGGTIALTTNNLAVFNANGANVARIDRTGKGFFNGGTQASGADVAEAFAIEGERDAYEPGDVLVISKKSDRTVEKCATPYSMLVAGVYATKPGMLLTERSSDESHDDLVPMGVVGVIPTKVTSENGGIERGDLLVTSSTPGHAMKADIKTLRDYPGAILGKALENFDGPGGGVIKVMVNVK